MMEEDPGVTLLCPTTAEKEAMDLLLRHLDDEKGEEGDKRDKKDKKEKERPQVGHLGEGRKRKEILELQSIRVVDILSHRLLQMETVQHGGIFFYLIPLPHEEDIDLLVYVRENIIAQRRLQRRGGYHTVDGM
jgi:hypothetical protein